MAVVHDLVILPPSRPLAGSVPAPPDDAIGTLALICAAMAAGTSEVGRIFDGSDAAAAVRALGQLGVAVEVDARKVATVGGVGLLGLGVLDRTIDCGASAKAMRLLAAAVAGGPRETVLGGDAALLSTEMADVVGALRRRGAVVEGELFATSPGSVKPPLRVGPLDPRRRLSGIEHEALVAGDDVKEALLLSGLLADDATFLKERFASTDHLERLLDALEVPIEVAGPIVRLDVGQGLSELPPFRVEVPGDLTAATILLAAATLVPKSRVCVRGTGLNATRLGTLDLMCRMGADVEWEVHRTLLGEPEGVACATEAPLQGIALSGESLARVRRELYVVVALAARARGQTQMIGLGALLGPASTAGPLAALLQAFGVEAESTEDGLVVEGKADGPLVAADVDTGGDPGLAATATLLALVGGGVSRVRGIDALARRFPRFAGTLRALGVDARVEERSV
jgi:3-phosphoshikimate 1-carboxyvinyltransferase